MTMRITFWKKSALLTGLVLATGCSGGQTGDLSGQNGVGGQPGGSTNTGGGCDDHATDTALDDASALGFSADTILAFAEKRFDSGLAWQATNGVRYVPGAGTSTLTLALTSLGKARLVHSTPPTSSGGGGLTLALVCPPDRLQISVHAELTTADGGLHESFDTQLEASDAAFAQLNQAFTPAQLTGAFAIQSLDSSISAPGAATHLDHLQLETSLSPAGIAGQLTGNLVSTGAQVSSSSALTFAHFPDDAACPLSPGATPGIPVSASASTLGVSGNEVLADVNARSPFPLSWSTGKTTELTLELADLQAGCLQEDRFAGISSSPQVSYPVTLKANTTDGALAGTYPVSLVVQRAPGGSGHQSVLEFTRQFADASGTGFHDVSIPSGTQRLSVVIDSQFTSANEGGHIVLNGLIDPPCVTNPEPPTSNSVPGCAGTSVNELVRGNWGVQKCESCL